MLVRVKFCPITNGLNLCIIRSDSSYIDDNKQKFIKNLSDAVAIKSVSAWPETRQEIFKMMKWVAEKLEHLGATTELIDIGKQVQQPFSYLTKFCFLIICID